MAEEGFALKQTVLGRRNDVTAANQQIVVDPADDDEMEDPEAAFLASLSSSQKRRLHRKLSELEGGDPQVSRSPMRRRCLLWCGCSCLRGRGRRRD